MKNEEKKHILKMLMQDALTDEEHRALLSSKEVTHVMTHQWNGVSSETTDDADAENAIWQMICRRLWNRSSSKKITFYRIYSIAASLLLLLAMSSLVYFYSTNRKMPQMYVVTSGIQNMEAVQLPDGTRVQMGAGSTLTYPAVFEGKTREVTLTGQAFFDVARNHQKPFIVHASDMSIQAVGTAFEVFSYDVEDKSEAILVNGKIKVGIKDKNTGSTKEYSVTPDTKLVYDKLSGAVTTGYVEADKYTSWRKQRVLSFENEQLSMIIPRLEQWYGRKIMCQKDLSERYRFTFKVRDEALDRILYLIQVSSPLKYTKQDNGDFTVELKNKQ
ncbi:MAG: FecR family protein [Parabacteroides sp.]